MIPSDRAEKALDLWANDLQWAVSHLVNWVRVTHGDETADCLVRIPSVRKFCLMAEITPDEIERRAFRQWDLSRKITLKLSGN